MEHYHKNFKLCKFMCHFDENFKCVSISIIDV